MSVVTTQTEMATSVLSTSNAVLLGRIERRRNGGSGDSPMDVLTRLPAVVVLERLSAPSLATARDGIILLANTAFAEMVAHPQDGLACLTFPETFHTVPRRSLQSLSVETSDHVSEPA
jgi:hypothetical protein